MSHGPVFGGGGGGGGGGGANSGSKFSPWGSLCERTPLGNVVGNLAQA